MNKENLPSKPKCMYCSNQATGIIYRPKNQLDNIFACTSHATNFFIPFHNVKYDKKALQQSRYRSPMKSSQISFSVFSQQKSSKFNPEPFFDRLMENIIQEFNQMKKQVMTNYNAMMQLEKNEDALKFRMEGDPSYPYMIINQDQDMMMNTFINRILSRHNLQNEEKRRLKIQKRRQQISTKISLQNIPQSKSPFTKEFTSVFLSHSIQGSPQKNIHQLSIEKISALTERKYLTLREYCKTQKREKRQV